MSGHSRWSTIKHKKGAADAKRGRIFTKVIKELTVAARQGGADPESNSRLRQAMAMARASNVPSDTVTRAIKRGTGELEGVSIEEVNYEGYGPGGVAILVETMTDSKNRTVAEIRHVFQRYNGSLGENGCVAWMFAARGLISIPKDKATEDRLMEVGLDAGIEDIDDAGDEWEVYTALAALEPVRKALEAAGIPINAAKATKVPSTLVKLEGKNAETMMKLYEALEEQEDVQDVYANFDVPEELLQS